MRSHSRDDIELNMWPIKENPILTEAVNPRANSAAGGSFAGTGRREPSYAEYEDEIEGIGIGGGSSNHHGGASRFYKRWADGFRRADSQVGRNSASKAGYGYEDNMSYAEHHGSTAGNALRPMLSRTSDATGAPGAGDSAGMGYYDVRTANMQTAHSFLARKLKGRHLQMIAIGGSIGTGLFVASGRALEVGGPASVLIAYSFIGCMLYCTVQALGELAVAFPVAGSFSSYSTRFLHPSWGFAMGWNYAMQWMIVLPLEIIAASITINYWNHELAKSYFVAIFLIFIIIINLFGVKGYGEAEFAFALIKVTAVIGFILLGIVLNIGGVPGDGYIGVKYWRDPGAFHNGFKGLCSVFVDAAFAFAGTELVGLAAAETENPRKSLPTAIKQVFWRITLFYVVALTLVGLLVPYDDPRLLAATSHGNGNDYEGGGTAAASPFVIAITNAGIDVLPSVMNGVILIAVLSVGNSAVFGSSRTLAALADQGQAPSWLSYIDRQGRPLYAIILASSVGLLAFLADTSQQATILDWLLAVSGLSSIFTWGSICLAHIRFRKAWKDQGHSLRELAFTSQCGVWGSYLGLGFNALVLIAQFWVGAWPIGFETMSSVDLAKGFFLSYMAVPIVIVFFVVHRLWARTRWIRMRDIDVDTGRRRGLNLPVLLAQESEERKGWPRWKRVYKFLC